MCLFSLLEQKKRGGSLGGLSPLTKASTASQDENLDGGRRKGGCTGLVSIDGVYCKGREGQRRMRR